MGFSLAPANTVLSEKLIVSLSTKSLLFPCGWGHGAGLRIAGLGAQQSPDEAAQFTSDGDFGFVALESPAQEPEEAQVQSVLRLPGEGAHVRRLAFLPAGQFFTDLGRQEVMLGALG